MRFCVTSAEATYAKQNMAESDTDDKVLRVHIGRDKSPDISKALYLSRGYTLLYIGIVCCSGHVCQREFWRLFMFLN